MTGMDSQQNCLGKRVIDFRRKIMSFNLLDELSKVSGLRANPQPTDAKAKEERQRRALVTMKYWTGRLSPSELPLSDYWNPAARNKRASGDNETETKTLGKSKRSSPVLG
jgi:hypothetical protein